MSAELLANWRGQSILRRGEGAVVSLPLNSSPGDLPGVYALVVEDDDLIRAFVAERLAAAGARTRTAGTLHEGLSLLEGRPGLIVLDVQLPDGCGLRLAEEALKLRPVPRVIAMTGSATREETFRLGRLHVQQYLEKPFGLEDLDRALAQRPEIQRDLAVVSALAVGRVGLLEARDIVRDSMAVQALAVAQGNRTRAAERLGVTRQAVQHALRELEPTDA